MTDVRLSTAKPTPSKPLTKPPAQSPVDSVAKPAPAGDSLKTAGLDQSAEALRIVQDALQFPPKPGKGEDLKPWLMDAYSRLLKAESGLKAYQKSRPNDDASRKQYSELRHKVWDAERTIERLDKGGAAKTEFFQSVLPSAQQLIDGLADHPNPPADKEGKAAWLAEAKQELAKAKAADELLSSAWFTFDAVPFEQRSEASRKIFDFESRIRSVEYELNPPAPRPRTSGTPSGSGSGSSPIFSNTQGAANLANSNNPIGQVAGAVALPIALTVDVIDLITRPLRWLDSVSKK